MAFNMSFLELRHMLSTPLGLIILYVFTNSLAGSIWINSAWTPFVFQLFGNSNIYVGLMEVLNGGFELIFAFLGGHLADKVIGPSRTLLIAVHFGIFTLVFTIFSVWLDILWVLMVSQALYGTYIGLSLTSVESVFAQCVKQGERDRIYSVKFSFEASGPIGGLLLSLILFSFFGNSWRADMLRWVITAGVVLHILSMVIFLLYFKPLPSHLDCSSSNMDEMVNEGNQVVPCTEDSRLPYVEEEITGVTAQEITIAPVSPMPLKGYPDGGVLFSSSEHEGCDMDVMRRGFEWKSFFLIPLKKYPHVVVFSDVVTTLGSGMTTKYFSLFMMSIYHVSPIGLSTLGLLTAMLISILAFVNFHIGKNIGRTRALLLPKFFGTLILLYMALSRETSAGPKWLMCIAYVLRMALMNSTTAISRALIMDIVSEKSSGMWNALESLQSASWSGTALIGGILADRLGYGAAFIATFGFHLIACLIIFPCTLKNDTVVFLK